MREYGWIGVAGSAGLYAIGIAIPAFREFGFSWAWPALVLGYASLTMLLLIWMRRAAKASSIRFVAAVNGATALKLLGSVAVVTTYLVLGGPHRVPFSGGLFAAFAWNTARFVWVTQTYFHQGDS